MRDLPRLTPDLGYEWNNDCSGNAISCKRRLKPERPTFESLCFSLVHALGTKMMIILKTSHPNSVLDGLESEVLACGRNQKTLYIFVHFQCFDLTTKV